MKVHHAILAFLLGLSTVYGQAAPRFLGKPFIPADNTPLSGEEWRLTLVEHLMSFPSPVTNGAIQLWGMGDEAAVDVLKLIAAKQLTPAEMHAVLDIVHMAFEKPDSIIESVNRKPRAAAFLLQYLGTSASDATVTDRLAHEAKFLQAVTIRSASSTPGK
jgi:hypothetical protein